MVSVKLLVVIVLFLIFRFNFCQCEHGEKNNLELVFTIFRHGDRTIDLITTYPKDPYRNETYYPYGYGELTNAGKLRMYKLGEVFQKQFKSFLGSLYLPSLIKSVSTDYSRTKCSLQLFLAGLFPPFTTLLEWNKNLNWNPIAFDSVSLQSNRLLSFPYFYCPQYQVLYRAYTQTPEVVAIENHYKPMYSYITQNTGLNVTSIFQLFILYFGLTCEKEWGLTLPAWTNDVFPNYLRRAAEDNYVVMSGTPQLNQLLGGFLLKKIINDMNQTINGTTGQPKMYVYSGHEISVVSILAAMNVYYPHVPNYSACVIIELHKINQKHYVKVRYNKYVFDQFVDMKIPRCTKMCPLNRFISLLEENIPEDGDPCVA
ncbi:hypothetical protein RN001_007840 [Aquatica leii]|uniref:acid phosphatase n=1 Tax=Aquatica leii TaxID=1421715 RepID=A0AAN7PWX5_9COLE|nr:hypothetical protein RN001_007840 [Aquatica leii]